MGENSRRGAPRSARAPGRAGQGRDVRAPRPGGRGVPGRAPVGYDGGRLAPGGSGRPSRQSGPASARLTSLIESVLSAMEIDLEAVKVTSAGRRVVLRIVVDADGGISLDDIAEVSREVSAKLDEKNAMGDAPYTLEVTSPGVDRPLTQHRHWRRAVGRLVVVPVIDTDHNSERDADAGPAEYLGRIIDVSEDRVTLEIDGATRAFSLGELGPGRVQVEFGRLDEPDDDSSQGEDIAGGSGPEEEEPDGH
jgi:ribosome maturation factor RimP